MTAPCSAIGQAVLISREGNKLKAYRDSVGVWTIGVGHTAGAGGIVPRAGMTISNSESLAMFARDHLKYAAYVDQALQGIKLEEHQRDALVSLCYNIGPKWFIGKKPAQFVTHIRNKRLDLVPAAMMKFTKPAEVTTRRQGEADQFKTPYSVRLPKARSNDARPVAAPLSTVAPVSPAIQNVTTPFRVSTIAGWLSDLINRIRGTPNVMIAYTKPPGFNGNDLTFQIQAKLREKGFTEVGKLDGWAGNDTADALRNCIINNGDDADAEKHLFKYTMTTLNYVNNAKSKAADALRQVATTVQVQQNAPEVMAPVNSLVRLGVGTLFGGGALGGLDSLKDTVDSVKNTADNANSALASIAPVIDTIAPVAVFVSNHPFLILGGIGALCLIVVGGQAASIVQLFRDKRIT